MNVAEFIYTSVLKPKPLKAIANAVIRWFIPPRLKRYGAVIALNRRDPVVGGAITLGVYERDETAFFRSVCKTGMTFLDVGANIGYYTALASQAVGETGRIIALEPDPESFQYLEQTAAANPTSNTVCIRKAAAAERGVLRLYVNQDNRGDNRLYPNDLCTGSCEVEVSTVDAVLEECGIPQVDLVKIDVQGFEGHVLRGMRDTLRRSNRLILMSEFWPQGLRSAGTNPENLLLELEQTGMRLYELRTEGRLAPLADHKAFVTRYPGRRYANIVAVRGERIPEETQGITLT